MEKEGKVDLLSILFASIVIFLVYAVMVFGISPFQFLGVIQEFPANATNASATRGFADSSLPSMASFNGSDAIFRCNITMNYSSENTVLVNISNVTLFLNSSPIVNVENSSIENKNATIFYVNDTTQNQTINFSVGTLGEGAYYWLCKAENNLTNVYNITQNRTFTIDKTPPGFRSNITNTSNAAVSTGDSIFVAVNATDSLTTIKVAALYVNLSGVASNEVDNTTNSDTVANNTINLTLVVPGFALGHVLNFTIRVNDSVDNFNITSALIFSVDRDGTPPGIILNKPANSFNQSTATAPDFNFTAHDNNETTSLTCAINISLQGVIFASIGNIAATNNTPQINTTTTTLSNGTYQWSVNCTDGAGNVNTSLISTFTVDQIPPVLSYFNITNSTTFNSSAGHTSEDVKTYDNSAGGSIIQGGTIFIVANWTDNLTTPVRAVFQFYNESAGPDWQTLNITNVTSSASTGWSNLSFPIPVGPNEFEGANVSFRIIGNDTVGNVNSSVKNITVQINDTNYPEVSIPNGSVQVNKTTISDPTPTISWVVNERNELSLINVSIDANTHGGSGLNTCRTSAIFRNTDVATDNVENNRNGTFTVLDDPSCSLLNGTHSVNITATDLWGNTLIFEHTFNVQSGSVPGLQFNLTSLNSSGAPFGTWIKSIGTWNDTSSTIASATTNRTSNITSLVGITLFGYNGAAANISNITYISSCNSSSTVIINNNTVVYPFNESSCNSQSENRTLTVTVMDSAGNSNETVIGFLVDNVGPTISVVHDPKPGQRFTNIPVTFNVSAFDDGQALSSFGFFLDSGPTLTVFNISNAGCVGCSLGSQGINLSTFNNTINLTSGTHTVKLRVNDTLGNARNSSDITFTIVGPITFVDVNNSLNTYLSNLNPDYAFNTTIRLRNDSGDYNTVSTPTESNNTFEIFLSINSSGSSYLENNATNITIKEINGSGANWDKINFSVFVNHTKFKTDAENNFTASLIHFVVFNNSFDEFLPNQNDYFATILLPFNISSYNSSGGSLSTAQEVWYFPNSSDLTQRTNVSICTTGFSRTSTTPCWNYTAGGKTLLSVPHFNSGGGIGNDTRAPTVTIHFPKDTQVESTFVANITVSNDAVLCNVSYIGAGSSIGNKTMTAPTTFGSSKICTFQLNVTNGTAQNNNISFQVYDGNNNLNTTTFNFNVSDTTVHNVSSVSAGSLTSSGATITLNANESVNLTIHRGTTIELTSTTNTSQSGFSTSPSASISSLSASTTYYYNITSCDKAGNCVVNGTYNFTTSAAAAEAAAAAAAASSGGGGGGGGAVSNVADSKAQVWTTIPAGSSFSLNIDKDTIGITSVSVSDIKSDLSNVEVEVQALKDNPVSAAAAAKVYQYLRINKKNIADTETDKITVSFRVTKSWLTENNIASGDIALYRYVDDAWIRLNTKVVSTDATYVNFEADTPGFSYFAIGSKAGGDAFAIIDAIRNFYAGTSSLSAFDIIDMIRAFYGG